MEKMEPMIGGKVSEAAEQERSARLISRFIETDVLGKHESAEEEEGEIRKYYAEMSPRDKADALYGKMMAYRADAQAESFRRKEAEARGSAYESAKPDPYLISEIKVLFGDPAVKKLLPETYGEARLDAKKLRASELGNLWKNITKDIRQKEEVYKRLEKDLHLNVITGSGKISATKSRMARLAKNLSSLELRKSEMEALHGFPITAEYTDTVASFQYETLKEYKRQLESGFVWFPSRKTIHQKTVSAILNHRWPVLIGEAGSGKSGQADAAALELTGQLPTEVECESTTGEAHLINCELRNSSTASFFIHTKRPKLSAVFGFRSTEDAINQAMMCASSAHA